jgi:soluble lytic murein transglycosylase-like protein
MPETAASIAVLRGLSDYRVERLDDAAYNLDLGAYHLASLIADYGGGDELDADVIGLAAAAYNAGPRRVEAWLGGATLPEETARYRRAVVAMWQARHDAEPPRLE